MAPITREGGVKASHVLPNGSRREQSKEGVEDSLQILQGAPLPRLAGCGQLVFAQPPDGNGSKATPNGKDGAGEQVTSIICGSNDNHWGSLILYEPLYICSASTVPVPSQTWRLSKFTSRYCSPWPKALIPAMLSKPRVGAADLFKASGPDGRMRCVRGERIQKGRGALTCTQGSSGRSTPEAGPRSES